MVQTTYLWGQLGLRYWSRAPVIVGSNPTRPTRNPPAIFNRGPDQSRIATYLLQFRKDGLRPSTIESHSKILRFKTLPNLKTPRTSRNSSPIESLRSDGRRTLLMSTPNTQRRSPYRFPSQDTTVKTHRPSFLFKKSWSRLSRQPGTFDKPPCYGFYTKRA